MLNSLRYKIGRLILGRKIKFSRREKAIFNFQTSHKIGVLFKTDTKEDFEIVKGFLYFLMEQKNEIVALCYVDDKKIPDYYRIPIGFSFFSRRNLNFFFLPKTQFILDFMKKPFDIMIDLSIDYNFPLYYICSLSIAKFKIGRYQNDNNCYDMMIDINKNNNVQSLIEQIKHYVPIFCKTIC